MPPAHLGAPEWRCSAAGTRRTTDAEYPPARRRRPPLAPLARSGVATVDPSLRRPAAPPDLQGEHGLVPVSLHIVVYIQHTRVVV